jgi:hypothetical protein
MAKQVSTSGMRRNAWRTGERFIESVAILVVDLNKFIVVVLFSW